jgi:hypothetical protein
LNHLFSESFSVTAGAPPKSDEGSAVAEADPEPQALPPASEVGDDDLSSEDNALVNIDQVHGL